jgi:hypothetical protein
MPLYRTNKDIFKDYSEEVFDNRFTSSEKLYVPKTGKWDYKRELKVEDIEIWEAIYEDSWGLGIYAAYEPYAEFYMIKYTDFSGAKIFDVYYGAGSQNKIVQFMIERNIPFDLHDVWVNSDEAWLYYGEQEKKIILT